MTMKKFLIISLASLCLVLPAMAQQALFGGSNVKSPAL